VAVQGVSGAVEQHRAPSVARIDLAAYRHNLGVVRRCAPKARILASVKADAYGHGLVPVARAALDADAHGLGVATIDEGIALRRAGITAPVLVLFQPAPGHLDEVVVHGLELMIADVDAAEALGKIARETNRSAAVHCHIDTGMGRQGFAPARAAEEIARVAAVPGLSLAGVATHFPTAEDPDDAFTRDQIARFTAIVGAIRDRGVAVPCVHAANSAAIVNYPEAAFDMVRPGIMTYGVWPSSTVPDPCPLLPVMHWETRITQIRDLEAGHGVSYGRSYVSESGMRTAVLPVGYADGYRIGYSNCAHVLIRGKRCPVRGRVCMDQTVAEITHVPEAATGDAVLLLGANGLGAIHAEELALHAGTIPYEVFTAVGNRVPRLYENEARHDR